jgi:hypothetical protein
MGWEATRRPLDRVVTFVPGTFHIAGVMVLFHRRPAAAVNFDNIHSRNVKEKKQEISA